jgi:hypothetical protein
MNQDDVSVSISKIVPVLSCVVGWHVVGICRIDTEELVQQITASAFVKQMFLVTAFYCSYCTRYLPEDTAVRSSGKLSGSKSPLPEIPSDRPLIFSTSTNFLPSFCRLCQNFRTNFSYL